MFEDRETAAPRVRVRGNERSGSRQQFPQPGAGAGVLTKGSVVGEVQEPGSRGRRRCAGLCGSPGGRAPLWGLMTGGGGLLFQPLFVEMGLEKEGPSRE